MVLRDEGEGCGDILWLVRTGSFDIIQGLTSGFRHNVSPLVYRVSGGSQSGYPSFSTALAAFVEAAARGQVELVLP